MTTALAEMDRLGDKLMHTAARLPVDEQAKALESQTIRLQAAQADALIDGERSGELKESGRATVRSFATAILRRSDTDAGQLAQVARHLVCFPRLAAVYREGRAHSANLRAIMTYVGRCGLTVLQAHEEPLVQLATRAGPGEIHQFCRAVAEVNRPEKDKNKVAAAGARMVRIVRVGELAHLDAMLEPELADQLKATLAAMAKASRRVGDDRSHAERSAEALEKILRRGMDSADLPTQARRRPHTRLSVQLETLLRMPGHGQAWLERFGIIPTDMASRIGCKSLVQLIVKHGRRVLSVGRTQRLVTDKQLAALATVYDSCLDLLVPLCKHDHTLVHEHGYALTREAGHWVFRDPHGRTIGDPVQALNQQLDLLHRATGPEAGSDATGEIQTAIATGLQHSDSRYRTGSWGWTGQGPHPPPGHGPPRSSDVA